MTETMQEQPANLNAEDAAAFMGGAPITAKTMLALARQKKIGHLKVGRSTVFPIAALRDYIDAHTIQPVENPWGLTDAAAASIRGARARRAS